MKKYLSFLLSVLLIASMLVSPIFSESGTAQAATMSIKAKLKTIEVGSNTTLTVTGTKQKVKWSTSNKKYVKIDSKGKATAVKKGSATITATVGKKKLNCKITVVDATTITASSLTLNVGKKDFVKVKVKKTGETKTAVWSSKNKKVATVDNTGIITGKGVGSTVITATIHGKKYTCKVKVNEKIAITKSVMNLKPGQTDRLTFKGYNKLAVWSSSNPKVAYVSYEGKVTGLSQGTSTITGRVDGTNYKCLVTVSKLDGITQGSYLVFVGDKKTQLESPIITPTPSITPSVTPSDTPTTTPDPEQAPVIWTTSNPTCVTVSDNGTLQVLKEGNVTITATVDGKAYTYYIVGLAKNTPYLKNKLFKASAINFDNINFVVPTSWVVDAYDEYGSYYGTISPYDESETCINIDITKSSVKAPEYYKTKTSFMRTMSEPMVRKIYEMMNSMFGVDFSFKSFNQGNYLSSNGNVFKTDFSYNLFGETYREVNYSFAIDQYRVNISVTDLGDVADIQKIAEYIVNSIYIQY